MDPFTKVQQLRCSVDADRHVYVLEEAVVPNPVEDLRALEARCLKVGLPTTWRDEEASFDGGDYSVLTIDFPNGRESRSVRVTTSGERLHLLEGVHFECVKFLGDYEAIWNTDSGELEAGLLQIRVPAVLRDLGAVPGVEMLDSAPPQEDEEKSDDGDLVAPELSMRDRPWRLRVSRDDDLTIEVSPSSDLFNAACGRAIGRRRSTIKIKGRTPATHEAALALLRDLAGAFFFDIDLRYGISVQLQRQRPRGVRRRSRPMDAPPEFPKNNYSMQPLELYAYGRSAQGMPLLEFLAYYQVLQSVFPIFTRDDVIRRLRTALRDPRFNVNDNVELGRLLGYLLPYGRGGIGEQEQLAMTLAACIDEGELREFLTSDEARRVHFTEDQSIGGVDRIALADRQNDLRKQAAQRVYKIRCRIVHTKQDGGETGVELLMPAGPEVDSLGHDIDLARWLAQQALIVGSIPLT